MAVTLLLIDDNPDQITITKRTLTKTGQDYRVDSACNAKEGLEKLAAGHYDIVMCDYRLPDVCAGPEHWLLREQAVAGQKGGTRACRSNYRKRNVATFCIHTPYGRWVYTEKHRYYHRQKNAETIRSAVAYHFLIYYS